MNAVLDAIVKEVEAVKPAIVVVDSFRTVVLKTQTGSNGVWELQSFVQGLALHLASWQATTFLVGEYATEEMASHSVFTVADGLFWLYQSVERNSIIRKLQIIKLRGQAHVPGLHTFRITSSGLQAFSRTLGLTGKKGKAPAPGRLSTGISELDGMLGGGIPAGDSILVAGPSGSGKSVLATQFMAEGIRNGEKGVVAVFEERPPEYAVRAASFGLDLNASILYLRPLDLSVEETMQELVDEVRKIGAKRLVIDSLSGFEMALAPGFRQDFRESLYRLISALTGIGVTILSTVEVEDSFTALPFSSYSVSFLSDDLIRLRFVSIKSELRKVLMVIKMRGGAHSKDIREYEITSAGIKIGKRLEGYQALITGIPTLLDPGGRRKEIFPEKQASKKQNRKIP